MEGVKNLTCWRFKRQLISYLFSWDKSLNSLKVTSKTFINICFWTCAFIVIIYITEWKKEKIRMRKKEREQSYIKMGSGKEGEKLSYICRNGKKQSFSWLELPWQWLAPSIRVHDCVLCVMGFCVNASQHLEMFFGVCICVFEMGDLLVVLSVLWKMRQMRRCWAERQLSGWHIMKTVPQKKWCVY